MVRFYTRIDGSDFKAIKYPWQMVIAEPALLNNAIYNYEHWEHAIIDCGIEHFLSGEHDEYKPGFFVEHLLICKKLTKDFGDRVWCTIPDYPDDYNPGHIKDNVGKTLRNIEAYHDIKGVNWIYPVQAKYLNKNSFLECCETVKSLYDPERIAIGTVCKTGSIAFIESCSKIARRVFKDSWIHAFGPTLSALPKMVPYLDSFDTTAYFRNPDTGEMCKNRKQRLEFFNIYRERVETIIKDYTVSPLTSYEGFNRE